MNWFASIAVGVLSAPLVGLIAGTATLLSLDWLRVSLREGASGFFIVAVTLFATLIGLVLGILLARGVFIEAPTFGKAFGLTVGSCFVVSLIGLGISGLMADPPPRVDGSPVDLVFELRMPPGVTLTHDAQASVQPYATIIKLSSGETRGFQTLQLDAARMEDGRQIIPGYVQITTRAASKMLNIYLDDARNLLFELSFPGTPRPADFEWTPWREAAYEAGTPRPSTDAAYAVRTVVRKMQPPPTQEEQQAQEDAKQEAALQALASDAPLKDWLVFTRYGTPQARIDAAIAAIRARPTFVTDMQREMLEGDSESSQAALRSLTHMTPAPTELADAVAMAGEDVAARLHALHPALPDEQQEQRNDASLRFSAWIEAARALQGHDDVSFVPQLKHILEPARARQTSDVIRIDVVRVASYYLQQWGGIAPLPTDPPPR